MAKGAHPIFTCLGKIPHAKRGPYVINGTQKIDLRWSLVDQGNLDHRNTMRRIQTRVYTYAESRRYLFRNDPDVIRTTDTAVVRGNHLRWAREHYGPDEISPRLMYLHNGCGPLDCDSPLAIYRRRLPFFDSGDCEKWDAAPGDNADPAEALSGELGEGSAHPPEEIPSNGSPDAHPKKAKPSKSRKIGIKGLPQRQYAIAKIGKRRGLRGRKTRKMQQRAPRRRDREIPRRGRSGERRRHRMPPANPYGTRIGVKLHAIRIGILNGPRITPI